MKITVTCIERIRGNGNKITGYLLMDDWSETRQISSDDLKNYIRSGQLVVRNLTLTSDNRLVPKSIQSSPEDIKTLDITGERFDNDISTLGKFEDIYFDDSVADDVYRELVDKYFGGSVNSYEKSKIGLMVEGLTDGYEKTLSDAGYTAKDVMKELVIYEIENKEDAAYKVYMEKFYPLLRSLNVENDVLRFFILLQLRELFDIKESYDQRKSSKSIDDLLDWQLVARVFNADRKLLVRYIDPMNKDKQGKVKIDIQNIRNGLAYVRDKINEIYFGNIEISYM